MLGMTGAYADYTVCKAEWLARVPVDILLNVAGGVPLVALTAFQVTSVPLHTTICTLHHLVDADAHMQGRTMALRGQDGM
jgi:NADPH:quinone reductase-like Zn-dependent oxidoreductase